METFALLRLALSTPPVVWNRIARAWIDNGPGFDHFPPPGPDRGELANTIHTLDNIIMALVRFREYLDMRYGAGCGDQGHTSAVKSSNKVVNNVRRVLGYTGGRDVDLRF